MECEPKCNTIVNVTNFGVNMTNERLRKMFENYGTISSYGVLNDDEPSTRFAFVTFEDSDAADEAVIELNGQLIDDNRRLRVRRTRKSENNRVKPRCWSRNGKKDDAAAGASSTNVAARASLHDRVIGMQCRDIANIGGIFRNSFQTGHSIYVQNLDSHVDRTRLRQAFEKYGPILQAKVIMYQENDEVKSKGYGFVTFQREADAQRAQREMEGRLIGTQSVHVEMARNNRPINPGAGSLPLTCGNRFVAGAEHRFRPRFGTTWRRPGEVRAVSPPMMRKCSISYSDSD